MPVVRSQPVHELPSPRGVQTCCRYRNPSVHPAWHHPCRQQARCQSYQVINLKLQFPKFFKLIPSSSPCSVSLSSVDHYGMLHRILWLLLSRLWRIVGLLTCCSRTCTYRLLLSIGRRSFRVFCWWNLKKFYLRFSCQKWSETRSFFSIS